MDSSGVKRIKKYIEDLYDIPFDVDFQSHYDDLWFTIQPHNSNKELFVISIRLKNQLRIVIEVNPQKYAAFSIQDMGTAPLEKKSIFAKYAEQLLLRKAKIDFLINSLPCNVLSPETWPQRWTQYSLRVSRSPICAEDEDYDEILIVSDWAAIIVGMFLSLLDIEQTNEDKHFEGGLSRVETNRYERNPVNRQLCLAANGYTCKICGFDFEKTYGTIGHNFIHVHHIVPVSKQNDVYEIDPIHDLIPVCPNCHAMLHRSDPPMLPKELEEVLRRVKG